MAETRVSPGDASPSTAYVVIVRRGAPGLLHTLKAHFDERVMWDRRIEERRTERPPVARERRAAERRGPPPGTWVLHGFLLALLPSPTGPLEPTGSDAERPVS